MKAPFSSRGKFDLFLLSCEHFNSWKSSFIFKLLLSKTLLILYLMSASLSQQQP